MGRLADSIGSGFAFGSGSDDEEMDLQNRDERTRKSE